ncbi:MAG: hypothetical protein HC769_17760 [Cyanobacteria bacterium CRU_2_1]|nr:hypothetical protein [Cyanobacteria bacterium CRU_2_1]
MVAMLKTSILLLAAIGVSVQSTPLLAVEVDSVQSQSSIQLNSVSLTREWSFAVEGYPVEHQGSNTLNISISGAYKIGIADTALPSFLTIYDDIDQFLSRYPNEDDYWEVLSCKLTDIILQNNPGLASVTVTIEVLPTQRLPYTRSTTVTRTDENKITERWSFSADEVSIEYQGTHHLNIEIEYIYQDGIATSQYPDYVPIYRRITHYLSTYPNREDAWEVVNRNLADTLLQEYPVMSALTSKLEVLPTQHTPFTYSTAVTRIQSGRAEL